MGELGSTSPAPGGDETGVKVWLIKTLALLGTILALAGILTQPTWSLLEVLSFLALGPALYFLLGGLAAFFAFTLALALQCIDPQSENWGLYFFLLLWSLLAVGGLLACVVLSRPSLGRKIDLGPFGPGGI